MQPLKITATLINGFTAADAWSPALDGILAYWKLRRENPEQFLVAQGINSIMEPVSGLPLDVVTFDNAAWWYACSSPQYELHASHRAYYHRRFDDQHERFLPESTNTVLTAAGPYKNYRKMTMLFVTKEIIWHCLGDKDAIRDLLRDCHHVGAKTAQGYGRVKEWIVEETGDKNQALFSRPLPVEYAALHEVAGITMRWGVRPPVRIPTNQCLCVMPVRSQ